MKKRFLAFSIALLMMITCTVSAHEATVETVFSDPSIKIVASPASPYASAYLSDYSIAFGARDNCRMVITMDVNAVRVMDRIGCMMLIIENKIDGTWYECDTLVSADYPEFYMYNTASYFHSIDYYGEPGVQYRVTMVAYARDSTGSDTGEVTSYVVTCRE